MIEKPKRYTVTAALIYANGPIHIGHLAGCYLPADIYVRYLRSAGKDVIFISGTDEHGVPITLKAKNEGIAPQQVVDKYYALIKKSFEEFGISFDIYSRTTDPMHHAESKEWFKKLYDKKIFSEEITEQYYDEKAGQFLADRYIIGTCPNCGFENAYGDQCERCGSTLSPTELINPKSTLSGEKPVLKKTKNWYLPLDKMQADIEKYISSHKEWKSNVAGQCQSWLKQGLQPRAMTRDLDWGVEVPLPETDGKVLYVWFDAPIGYITFTKQLFEKKALLAPDTYKKDDWQKYWKDKDTKLVHFIGKDNIVFHCIIFPAMLMAEGSYILPDNVPANEFMNLEGQKISTSRNWAIWLHEYLQEFPGMQDVLRYTLCANAPETKDSDFTWKDFQLRNNSELADIFGNFVNRVMVLTHKNFAGKVPAASELTETDHQLIKLISDTPRNTATLIEQFKFRDALASVMDLARAGNKYLADTEPWKLIKTNPERVKTILNLSAQIVANLGILCEPFMPFTAAKLNNMLNIKPLSWNSAGSTGLLPAGHQLGSSEILFAQIENTTIENQIKKLEQVRKMHELAQKQVTPLKPEIQFEDFTKLDIRIGTIIQAERIPKTKKLLKLLIDTGLDKRTIVSGIGEHYEPEKIIGKQICLLANLAAREIKGVASQGMILMAEDKDGSLKFILPESLTANGSVIA
ncbi:MAG: methionine--tRNA ligase [Cytophagaceae bacterium]|nr:methionine--tRNA ligase [Cytophagaceae bacterium]MDW8455254.1 methionine--tRNA ligase [Cytophagaceae bacterium]